MGAASIVLKLGMPALLRRHGTLPVFAGCMRVWPLAFAALPLAALEFGYLFMCITHAPRRVILEWMLPQTDALLAELGRVQGDAVRV